MVKETINDLELETDYFNCYCVHNNIIGNCEKCKEEQIKRDLGIGGTKNGA